MTKYLENGERISFAQLLKENSVSIPMIQRDFVQGRKDEKEVRTGFLRALKKYLQEGKPFRDLDFVYGFLNESNVLYPLDGQQRLTTLMLLHWYLANREGDNEFQLYKDIFLNKEIDRFYPKFTYENRVSSKEFFNQLLTKRIDFRSLLISDVGKNNILSKTITNFSWYAPAWNWDPTIQNTLNMLDAIHVMFNDSSGYFSKLMDEANPVITFLFMDLGKNNLSDDLYIKMNSRGVELSSFENFKAKLERFISEARIDGEYELKLGSKIHQVDFKTYYTHRLDGKWSNLIWKIMRKSDPGITKPKNFDHFYSNLFRISFLHSCLNSTLDTDTQEQLVKRFLTIKEDLSFYDYEESFKFNKQKDFNVISDSSLKDFIELVDLLSTNIDLDNQTDFEFYDVLNSFHSLLESTYATADYHNRVMFFAYTEYLKRNKGHFDLLKLKSWLRFISNLSNSTAPYNNVKEFINAILFIKKRIEYSDDIDAFLVNQSFDNVTGFDSIQYKEEVLKRKIEKTDPSWRNVFENVELHPYLKGQTYFLLTLVGIKFENFDTVTVDILKKAQQEYLSHFEVFKQLFTDNGLNKDYSEEGNYLFERALLSIDDYTIQESSNFSFLINSDRDISWKRFLKFDKKKNHSEVVYKLFSTLQGFTDNIESGLESLIDRKCSEWWRYIIINNPDILDFYDRGKKRYFRKDSKHGFILLRGVKISGSHVELESYNFYLKNKFKSDKWKYEPVSGENNDSYPSAYFDFIYNKLNYKLEVSFIEEAFIIVVKRREAKDYDSEILDFFRKEGFVQCSNYYAKRIGTYDECLKYLSNELSQII